MRTSPTTALMPEAAPWCLYLLECRNGAYYAGITNRLEARNIHGAGACFRIMLPIRQPSADAA